MKKRVLARLLLMFLGVPFLVGHGLLCALSWTSGRPQESQAQAVDLLLDLTAFPSEWVVAEGPFSAHNDRNVLDDVDARDYAQVTFAPRGRDPDDVNAIHAVYAFSDSLEAAINFYTRFPEYPRYPPVMPQSERVWLYRSRVADHFALYCQRRIGTQDCTAVGQYGQFISLFGVRLVYNERQPPPDLMRLLEAIDERMARYLDDRGHDDDTDRPRVLGLTAAHGHERRPAQQF